MPLRSTVLAIFVLGCLGAFTAQGDEPEAKLQKAELGETRNVHAFGKTLLCGQPSKEDLAAAKQRGVAVVITLRGENEIDWNEQGAAEGLGLEFYQLGFQGPETLTDAVLSKSLKLLANADEKPVLLHCGSANRVGAVWAAHRVLNDGLTLEAALEEAKEVGLRTPGYADKVRDYVARQKKPE